MLKQVINGIKYSIAVILLFWVSISLYDMNLERKNRDVRDERDKFIETRWCTLLTYYLRDYEMNTGKKLEEFTDLFKVNYYHGHGEFSFEDSIGNPYVVDRQKNIVVGVGLDCQLGTIDDIYPDFERFGRGDTEEVFNNRKKDYERYLKRKSSGQPEEKPCFLNDVARPVDF